MSAENNPATSNSPSDVSRETFEGATGGRPSGQAGGRKMRVARAFTVRNLRKNRVRTIVTVVGIALSTALLTAVLVTLSSLTAFMYNEEAAQQGAWHVSVTTDDAEAIDQALTHANVKDLSTLTDVGYAKINVADSRLYGHYLAVQALGNNFDSVGVIPLLSGRMPENSHEILLSSIYRETATLSAEPCTIGTQITLDLGVRKPVAVDGASLADMPDYLDTNTGYYDADVDDGSYDEEFVDAGLAQTYTVVGFYDTNNIVTSTGAGSKGFTVADAETVTAMEALGEKPLMTAYFSTADLSTTDAVRALAESMFGEDADIRPHDALLRYAGISDDRVVWDTLYQMAGVLAVVIIVASAALIYNSFAISVSDRTRQFGLLASIGASRKQIRAMVRYEALVLAAIGIPLGLVVGIGGSFVVLEALSPALSSMLGGQTRFGLHADATSLVIAVVLALVVVAISAWLPSRRAARVSAVDAVRNTQDVRVGRNAARKTHNRAAASSLASAGHTANSPTSTSSAANSPTSAGLAAGDLPWKPRGLALGTRLLGVPGTLAQRNATRSRSKGRVATASLLLAVVLLVTAGALNLYLSTTIKVAGGVRPYDVSVSLFSYRASLPVSNMDASAASTEPSSQLTVDDFSNLYENIATANDIEGVGAAALVGMPVTIPSSMAASGLMTTDRSAVVQADGAVETQVQLYFVDDASYRSFLESQGLDPAAYMDPAHPQATAIRQAYGNDGSTYQIIDMWKNTGTIELYAYEKRANAYNGDEHLLDNGQMGTLYHSSESDTETTRAEAAHQFATLEVGALVDATPAVVDSSPWSAALMVPMSFAAVLGLETADGSTDGSANISSTTFTAAFDTTDHVAAVKSIKAYSEQLGLETYVYDSAAEQEQREMLATVIETFSLCFAGILTLIAVTNVFNTLVNSLMLRRREFAVLKSVGMDNRAFNRMIAGECVRYGVRGLIGGLIVSVGVSFLLFRALEASISGLTFVLPWASMGLAVLVVVLATVASTVYGLHRSRANNVVEALRADMM